jgi:hypothetical protein
MNRDPIDVSVLDPKANEGYIDWPLPSSRDDEIARLIDKLVGSAGEGLSPQHGQVLMAFAERMASLARRIRLPQAIRTGLLSVVLAAPLIDRHEGMLVLPLLWRSAEVLGLDPAEEFRSASSYDGGELLEFLRRDPSDRTIEAMGYVEVETKDGFRYVRTW